jgi:hypothetical protein
MKQRAILIFRDLMVTIGVWAFLIAATFATTH